MFCAYLLIHNILTYLAWATKTLGLRSLENCAFNVSHSMNVKLYVFMIPKNIFIIGNCTQDMAMITSLCMSNFSILLIDNCSLWVYRYLPCLQDS